MSLKTMIQGWLGIEERAPREYPYGRWNTRPLGPTNAGVVMTEARAFRLAPVYQAVTVLAQEIATLPLETWATIDDERMMATTHPAYRLLRHNPNPMMTAHRWRLTEMARVLLFGNSFTLIERDGAFRPRALWPLDPSRVQLYTDSEGRDGVYVYQPIEGGERTYNTEDVIHVRGLNDRDPLWGRSTVEVCLEALGLTHALEEFGARFFGDGAMPSGVLEHPGQLGEEAHRALVEDWDSGHGGRQRRTALLEEGMKFNPTTIPPEEGQMLGTREFQILEVARVFNLPPQRIGGKTDPYTYSSVEQEKIAFYTQSIRPWATTWEQEIARKLLPTGLTAEFNMEEALRGDTASRFTAYQTAVSTGWLLPNEVRKIEGLNEIPGLDDAALGSDDEEDAEVVDSGEETEASDESEDAEGRSLIPVLAHTVERCLSRQRRALERARAPEPDPDRAERFFDAQGAVWAAELEPALVAYRSLHGTNWDPVEVSEALGARLVDEHRADFEGNPGDLEALWSAADITEEIVNALAD